MANPTPEQRKEAAECLRDANIRIYDWASDDHIHEWPKIKRK